MDILNILKILLLPEFCAACERPGNVLCQNCRQRINTIKLQSCIICDRYSAEGATHKACISQFAPDKFLSAFAYGSTVKKIILKSKFGPRSFKLLDILIHSQTNTEILKYIPCIDIIVPVPMAERLRSRRLINHSEYISSKVGNILQKPTVKILEKRHFLKSQKKLQRNFRFQNIKKGIFLKNEDIKVKGKNVLLADDIATTGATLIEASRILKINGAKKVYCYTLAKDLRYNEYTTGKQG